MTVFEASLRDKYIDSVVNFSAFYNIFINIITELKEKIYAVFMIEERKAAQTFLITRCIYLSHNI